MSNQDQNPPYASILPPLKKNHIFYLPVTSLPPPILPKQTQSTISSLSLHPTLESALHLLNRDLPSAHFLLRHAQAAPAYESMYLHGILHRIEGDVDNARAWYGDVRDSEVFRDMWGDEDEWKGFLDRVERWRDRIRARKGSKIDGGDETEKIDWDQEREELSEISLKEVLRVLEFCEKRFGTGKIEDARSGYTLMGEKHKDIAAQMITGGEGWREF